MFFTYFSVLSKTPQLSSGETSLHKTPSDAPNTKQTSSQDTTSINSSTLTNSISNSTPHKTRIETINSTNESSETLLTSDKETSSMNLSIPKLKLKINRDQKEKELTSTPLSEGKTNKTVKIVKNNVASYLMFPVLSSPEESDDNNSPCQSTSLLQRDD